MKIKIVSDLHLGDPSSCLLKKGSKWRPDTGFDRLVAACGTDNDYLVLLGDILDFTILDYTDAYSAAQAFFFEIAEKNIARDIIYIIGNHDNTLWHIVMHEANVIDQINAGKVPRKRPSMAGIIDHRSNPNSKLVLAGVQQKKGGGYGGLFLDNLSYPRTLSFSVAYPNLYIVDPIGQTTLITHGHYFEDYWAFLLELSMKMFGPDLILDGGDAPSIKDIVQVNFPLNELASSGLGQAGALTPLVRKIQTAVYDSDLDSIHGYIDRLFKILDNGIVFKGFCKPLKEYATDKALQWVKDLFIGKLKTLSTSAARNNPVFPNPKCLEPYLAASFLELHEISLTRHIPFPNISNLIFGHTHIPIQWGERKYTSHKFGQIITLANTGGWICQESNHQIVPAIVVCYDSETPVHWTTIAV